MGNTISEEHLLNLLAVATLSPLSTSAAIPSTRRHSVWLSSFKDRIYLKRSVSSLFKLWKRRYLPSVLMSYTGVQSFCNGATASSWVSFWVRLMLIKRLEFLTEVFVSYHQSPQSLSRTIDATTMDIQQRKAAKVNGPQTHKQAKTIHVNLSPTAPKEARQANFAEAVFSFPMLDRG